MIFMIYYSYKENKMKTKQKFLTARVETMLVDKIHSLRKSGGINLSAVVRNFIRNKIEEINLDDKKQKEQFTYLSIALDEETFDLINSTKDKKINWSKEIREYLRKITE